MDKVVRLRQPMVPGRTNPVTEMSKTPGGVALSVATMLASFGAKTTLFALKPHPLVEEHLRLHNIRRVGIGNRPHNCGYTAVLGQDNELAVGLAQMDEYERDDPEVLPISFPGRGTGMAMFDANFSRKFIAAAAKTCVERNWRLIGAATSVAKAERLAGIVWDLMSLNQAEAERLTNSDDPGKQARILASRTGGIVSVTCGAKGVFLRSHPHGKTLFQASPKIRVKSSNGAGDAFCAALGFAFAARAAPEDMLRLAVATGVLQAQGGLKEKVSLGKALELIMGRLPALRSESD